MPIEYEILNEQKNHVTSFDSKEEADKYISENSDKNYLIKEKKSWDWKDYIIFVVAFGFGKLFGFGGFISVIAGYYLNRYLIKRINKYLSIGLSILAGFVIYVVIVYAVTQ